MNIKPTSTYIHGVILRITSLIMSVKQQAIISLLFILPITSPEMCLFVFLSTELITKSLNFLSYHEYEEVTRNNTKTLNK